MANSKQYLFLIILASWAVVGLGSIQSMACMQKLMPCQSYFKKLDNVPDTCCTPMKNMLSETADDKNCVCGVFGNPIMLKNLNITQDDTMKLAKACGLKADISKCDKKEKDTASPSSSPTESTPSPSPSASNAASRFGKSGFIASFIATLIFSAAF
ncbi:non-specific lipid transfer protein GPI-anchored 9-like [Rosa sericea]